MSWPRLFVIDLSLQSRFNVGPVSVGLVLDKWVLGQVFLQILPFSSVGIIPPMLSTYMPFIYH
jgi:hypothetical protein